MTTQDHPTASPWRVAARAGERVVGAARDPEVVFPALLLVAFIVRAAWLDVPPGALIFDETYYVNAARILLGWVVPAGAPYAGSPIGLDPNIEHPPLGKALIAASMLVFGDNGVGRRLPSVAAGMVVIGASYLIARRCGATTWMSIMVAGFIAFDNLMLVHSRIGTLDMLVLAPVLVGAWVALRGHWAVAGIIIGAAALIKLTALYALLALLILLGLKIVDRWRAERRVPRTELRHGAALVIAFSIVAVVGLAVLDRAFTTFSSPLDHLVHMVRYGTSLTTSPGGTGSCPAASAPWQWLFNECQINYLRVEVNVPVGDAVIQNVPTIDFRGAMNPLLAAAIPLATMYLVWAAWRTRDALAVWATVWAAANFLPYVFLVLVGQRVTYLYYFLPVIPAMAIALAILLVRAGLPRPIMWAYIAAYGLGFLALFPFRVIP